MAGKRPLGVGLISLLLILNGIMQIVVGILLITHTGEEEIIDAMGIAEGSVTTFAVIMFITGGLTLLVAFALRGGANWARLTLVVLFLLQVAGLIWSAIELHGLHWSNGLWPVVIAGLAAGYLLFDEDSKRFFGSSV